MQYSFYYALTQNQWRKKNYDEEGKEMKKKRKRRENKCSSDLAGFAVGL